MDVCWLVGWWSDIPIFNEVDPESEGRKFKFSNLHSEGTLK